MSSRAGPGPAAAHDPETQKHYEKDDLANLRDAMKGGGLRGVNRRVADPLLGGWMVVA